MKFRIIAAVGLFGVAGGFQAEAAKLFGTRRTEVQRAVVSVPGREVIQTRVELDPGVTSAKHKHPGEEVVFVLKGSIEYRVEGRELVTLRAGEGLTIPKETFHTAKNVGSGIGEELATYIVEEGKPLVEVSK